MSASNLARQPLKKGSASLATVCMHVHVCMGCVAPRANHAQYDICICTHTDAKVHLEQKAMSGVEVGRNVLVEVHDIKMQRPVDL